MSRLIISLDGILPLSPFLLGDFFSIISERKASIRFVKLGNQMFFDDKLPFIISLAHNKGFRVMADLKLWNTPSQVEKIVEMLEGAKVNAVTISAFAGTEVIRAAFGRKVEVWVDLFLPSIYHPEALAILNGSSVQDEVGKIVSRTGTVKVHNLNVRQEVAGILVPCGLLLGVAEYKGRKIATGVRTPESSPLEWDGSVEEALNHNADVMLEFNSSNGFSSATAWASRMLKFWLLQSHKIPS